MLRRWLLRNFRRVYRLDGWFRAHLTPAGYLVLFAAGAAAVIGINPRLTLAVQIFSLLSSVLLIAYGSSLWFRPRLHIRRLLPPMATAGEPMRYILRVENHNKKRQQGLFITDELQMAWPSVEDFQRRHDPEDSKRNPFDRFVGYPKWLGLIRRQRGAEVSAQLLPAIAPGGSVDVSIPLLPLRRGYLRFAEYRLARPDPFGLFKAISRIADPASLLILPKRYPTAQPKLSGGRLYQPGGIALAATRGDAEEFVSLRDYRPGDSPRDIHWRSWAKIGKPIVKEKRPEYFTRHALVLDTFCKPADEALFEEAVAIAASFVCHVDTQENLLDLLFVGEQAYRFSAGRGLGGSEQLLKILACVERTDSTNFQVLHDSVLQQARQFSACILVFMDWDQARRELAEALRCRGIQTRILIVIPEQPAEGEIADEQDVTFLPLGRIAERLNQWQ